MKDLLIGGRKTRWGRRALRRTSRGPSSEWETQGPVGLLQVHRVSRRHRPCKLINRVRNQLSHVHTHLCQNGINQLTLWQGEVRVLVAGQNIAKLTRQVCEVLIFTHSLSQYVGLASHPLSTTFLG
ncbi:hypothetical protein GmHk_14G041573 [Glycine max]|nr:hypothetical protein GmHk_14G041573 [Glycine max]